jgi:HSP20 family protein
MAVRNIWPEVWRRADWNPVRELSRVQSRINHIFDEMFEPISLGNELLRPEDEAEFTPAWDVQETENHYLVTIDIPGVPKDRVNIQLRDNQLIVSGERRQERERQEGAQGARESHYGTFVRSLPLSMAIDAEKIEANYENGVLQIVVPKTEAMKPKTIPIKEERGGIFNRLIGHKKPATKAA